MADHQTLGPTLPSSTVPVDDRVESDLETTTKKEACAEHVVEDHRPSDSDLEDEDDGPVVPTQPLDACDTAPAQSPCSKKPGLKRTVAAREMDD